MKKVSFLYLLLFVSILTVGLSGCKPQDEPLIGTPTDPTEGIEGSFKLSNVVQVDELTSKLNKKLDISAFFIGAEPMMLTFAAADSSVTIVPGTTPDYFGNGLSKAKWMFDDAKFPTQILINGGTSSWGLLRPIRSFDKTIAFKLSRSYKGKLAVTYQFTFTRQ